MNVAVLGEDCALARATSEELARRGHAVSPDAQECAIFFPGKTTATGESLARLARGGPVARLVLRSHAFAYGSNAKNPGGMTEERVSLLPLEAPESAWLKAEEIALRHPNAAVIRLTTVLARDGDLLARQIAEKFAATLPGRDPNVQFLSLRDAARALVAAAESSAKGIFNAAADEEIPLFQALRAAGTTRIPTPKFLQNIFRRDSSPDQMEFNWTVSRERAERELGFRAERTTREALADFLREKSGARPELLRARYDDWGQDYDVIRRWGYWFNLVRKYYWRIEMEGTEHLPRQGRALYVSNHRGFMPLDGVMHLYLGLAGCGRAIRFLIIPSLLYPPFMSNFWTKLGCVVASQESATRLFAGDNIVGIFPEGIRGTFLPYRETYKLRDFSKSGFVQMAIENQAPILPVVVVGHAEIFPIIGRIDSTYLKQLTGWPYFPIAPPFPFLPMLPLPSKWHMRVLPPISVAGLSPADAQNKKVVHDVARYVQNLMQQNLDHMLARRKHIFWGRVLDGTAPPRDPLPSALPMDRVAGSV